MAPLLLARSVKIAKKHNIDITEQRGRQFEVSDFDNFDVIYAMDNSNFQNILKLARDDKDRKKVHLILNEILPGEKWEGRAGRLRRSRPAGRAPGPR